MHHCQWNYQQYLIRYTIQERIQIWGYYNVLINVPDNAAVLLFSVYCSNILRKRTLHSWRNLQSQI